MNEYDLLKAIGDINEKYIEKAAVEEETLTVSTKETHIMKKKYIILLVCITVLLVTSSVALAYYENKKTRERIVAEQSNERAIVTIPEKITKIRIVDGMRGDVLTLDGDDIVEFFTKLNSVSGTVEYVGEGSGYQYAVHCYRSDERVLSFVFMTETIIKENMGDGTDRRFTSEEVSPAYAFIQRVFDEARANN